MGKQFCDYHLTSPIESDDSSRLCDDVAGWATALQLIALSARQNNSSAQHSARRLAGINASHLSDYLVDEVLNNVDARTRNFLLKSSLLRSMNDALIVRVTGEENGQMQLEEIERQGLFLQRMDDSGEWFRYHPLFGSFLRQRCQWELAVVHLAIHCYYFHITVIVLICCKVHPIVPEHLPTCYQLGITFFSISEYGA